MIQTQYCEYGMPISIQGDINRMFNNWAISHEDINKKLSKYKKNNKEIFYNGPFKDPILFCNKS